MPATYGTASRISPRHAKLLGYQPEVTHEQGFRDLATWLAGQQAEDKAETMLGELNTYGLTA